MNKELIIIILIILSINIVDAYSNNTISISDATLSDSITIPIMIHNSTGVAVVGLHLNFNASLVNVSAIQGDFTGFFGVDNSNISNGSILINTFIINTDLIGEVKVADITLKSKGVEGHSPLNLDIIVLADKNATSVPYNIQNGTLHIIPPVCSVDIPSNSTINFGHLYPGETSNISSVPLNISQGCNTPITTTISGTDWVALGRTQVRSDITRVTSNSLTIPIFNNGMSIKYLNFGNYSLDFRVQIPSNMMYGDYRQIITITSVW